MKVGKRYSSTDDVYQQLHNTIVELDGELCHIERYDGWVYSIRKVVQEGKMRRWAKQVRNENIKDMDLNLQQFPLGYINSTTGAYYLQRKPLRKWKQGYYADYLRFVPNPATATPAKRNGPHARIAVGANLIKTPAPITLIHTQSMVDLYDNNYPSFHRAWIMIKLLDKLSVAWHRHWAFQSNDVKRGRGYAKEYWIMYKGKHVGFVKDGNVVLKHEFRYLTEPFVEAMIHAS